MNWRRWWKWVITVTFGGIFGSAPLDIVGGALTDFWGPVDRGIAICIFSGAMFIGPVAGKSRYLVPIQI
jgi:hypothetical protein